MTKNYSCDAIYQQLGLQNAPVLFDVRPSDELKHSGRFIPTALCIDANEIEHWCRSIATHRAIAVYCTDGEVSSDVAARLAARGIATAVIDGGFRAWTAQRFATVRVRPEYGVPGLSRWVTRERPKIDRVACPWLVRRFIDPHASFFYVSPQAVRTEAAALGAEPYDIADVTFSHRADRCSFDAFLSEFGIDDPVLDSLATIVRSADTGALAVSKEAPGLLAISLGLSATISNDILLLEQATTVYDALYAWCKTARHETHSWPQSKVMNA